MKKNKSPYIIKNLKSYLGIINDRDRLNITKKLLETGFHANTDLSDFRKFSNLKKPDLKINWFKKIMFHDLIKSKIPRTLRFRDRISSACSRELRFPFLDHNFLTYALSSPIEYKFNFGLPKYPLREIVKKYFKEDFKFNKRSVTSPQTDWIQGPLKDWTIDNLNSLKTKNLIDGKYITLGKK